MNDAKNIAIVDFNTLANIEPTVVNVFYMPVGSDLEFRSDKTGKYFVDTRTGKEIREPVKPPAFVLTLCIEHFGADISAIQIGPILQSINKRIDVPSKPSVSNLSRRALPGYTILKRAYLY